MNDLPDMPGTPVPFLPKQYVKRTLGLSASFDAGRGCPYQCSFCTIINVQGRKSRFRTTDDIEHLVRLNWAQGINKFFLTDDNFARNKEWESIFDRLIVLREKDGIPLGLMIQVDTLCHKIPNFIEKAKRAGVTRVFIGLENVNPDNLAAAKKRQNKITEYRKMLLDWKAQGIITIAGYILGFPSDTPATIRRDIAIIQEELPLDIIEFFCLTPLPGSEDHQTLWKKGVAMEPDLNKYDIEHVCTAHPRMSREEWQSIYREAWSIYYTPKHMARLLRRAVATGVPVNSLIKLLVNFATTVRLENVHPLQGGILRLKHPSERRPGLPRERALVFWPRFVWETISKHAVIIGMIARLLVLKIAITRDAAARTYTDVALTPVSDDEDMTLDLLTKTTGAHGGGRAHPKSRGADPRVVASGASPRSRRPGRFASAAAGQARREPGRRFGLDPVLRFGLSVAKPGMSAVLPLDQLACTQPAPCRACLRGFRISERAVEPSWRHYGPRGALAPAEWRSRGVHFADAEGNRRDLRQARGALTFQGKGTSQATVEFVVLSGVPLRERGEGSSSASRAFSIVTMSQRRESGGRRRPSIQAAGRPARESRSDRSP